METAQLILEALGRASFQGAVAIGVVWLVCRLFPRLPASLRCGLWWLASLKLLVALVWIEPIPLPLLPVAEPAPTAAVAFSSPSPGGSGVRVGEGDRGGEGPRVAEATVLFQAFPWAATLAALWTAGLLLQLGLTLRQLVDARRIVRGAEPVEETWITALFAELRERLGVRRADLLASPEVETPQVTGTWRPSVLLPRREIGRLSEQELALTLGHELLHVRRGDLWLGWVPALAQRLFFFHPLAALAAREYAVAREAACDAAVLRVLDPAPETYGRLLLRLGVAPRVPRMAAATAAPTFQTLKRRLEMLQQASEKKRIHPGWWGLIALLAVMTLIPFRMVAQEAAPEPPAAPEAPAAPAAPVKPGEPAKPAELGRPIQAAEPGRPAQPTEPGRPAIPAEPGRPAIPLELGRPAQAAAPPAPVPQVHPVPHAMPVPSAAPAPHPVAVVAAAHPAPPPPPPAPPAPPAPPRERSEYRYSDSDDGDSYILLYGSGSVTMNGSTSDLRKVKQISDGKPLLWFERNGKSYVVKDAATLARIQELFEPQREMGEKQGALGEQQAKLGEQQARLGAQMGEMGTQQAAQAGRLAAHAANKDDSAGRAKAEADMEALGDKMEALGRQMEELGRKQEALGRQQEELGRQQEKLGRNAERQLRTVIDQTLANGLAKEMND